jgi:glucose 1-dehydrogenase
MRALTVSPGHPHSLRLEDVDEPSVTDGDVLVETLAIGICGTDREIAQGRYGSAPPGADRLIIGHESLGRVASAPSGGAVCAGDLIAGIVRRPDPVPCPACAIGEWDMCRNGRYTERGIKGRNGYAAERFRVESEFVIRVDNRLGDCGVLIEPTSVVAKAWDQIERIGSRARSWQPRTVLVTGAGPIGLLAAMLGVQRGCDVHVFDRAETGLKPALVRALGATYHAGHVGELEADLVVECTGATSVILEAVQRVAADGLVCLAGVSSGGYPLTCDIGNLNRRMVLENTVVFGTVNANRTHYDAANAALARSNQDWLRRLITRRVPLDRWYEALERHPDDIKVVIDFATKQSSDAH